MRWSERPINKGFHKKIKRIIKKVIEKFGFYEVPVYICIVI